MAEQGFQPNAFDYIFGKVKLPADAFYCLLFERNSEPESFEGASAIRSLFGNDRISVDQADSFLSSGVASRYCALVMPKDDDHTRGAWFEIIPMIRFVEEEILVHYEWRLRGSEMSVRKTSAVVIGKRIPVESGV